MDFLDGTAIGAIHERPQKTLGVHRRPLGYNFDSDLPCARPKSAPKTSAGTAAPRPLRGNRASRWHRKLAPHYCPCGIDDCGGPVGQENACGWEFVLSDFKFNVPWDGQSSTDVALAEDGKTLTTTTIYRGQPGTPEVYTKR